MQEFGEKSIEQGFLRDRTRVAGLDMAVADVACVVLCGWNGLWGITCMSGSFRPELPYDH